MTARTLLGGLHLLDRQIVDRHDRLAGKVDDVELTRDEATGHLVVTALLSGRGALARRLGAHRLAAWLARQPEPPGADPALAGGRIPVGRITAIGPVVKVGAAADELPTHAGEGWARRHLVTHLPGNRDVAE
jgi:hypothetical protein